MAKKFTCPECGEEMTHGSQNHLIEMVQQHAEQEHDMDLDEDDIREGIEDT